MSIEMRSDEFPPSLPCALGGEMKPRYWFPHVQCAPSRPFMLYWSDALSYGCLHPTPSDEELARFYAGSDYGNYLAGTGSTGSSQRKSIVRRLVEGFVYRVAKRVPVGSDTDAATLHQYLGRPSDICDIGCGSGVMLQELAARGHRVAGVEPNEGARMLGVQRGIDIVKGTGEDISGLGARRFDLVTMFQSLEHTRDPQRAVRNCAELLKPGGTLWLEVPNHQSAGFGIRGPVWFHTDAGRHIHFFTRASLETVVRQAELEYVEARYSGYLRQFFWLDAETRVWDSLYTERADTGGAQIPDRPDVWSLLRLLSRTRSADPALQCDSVTVLARKPDQCRAMS